jgi:hypothetical protein
MQGVWVFVIGIHENLRKKEKVKELLQLIKDCYILIFSKKSLMFSVSQWALFLLFPINK